MEIGNQVFMQYKRNEDGSFSELANKNIDFGGGLERIAAASLNSYDVFEISLLKPIIQKLEELSGKKYQDYTVDMRVIADHLRGAYLFAAQGLTPSNKQHGYAMRRLVRRAILKSFNLGIEDNFLDGVIPIIAESYEALPDSILTHREQVLSVLIKEEQAFRQTLRRGMRELNRLKDKGLTGKELFMLKDTYGFPLELAVETAEEQGIELSKDWEKEFDAHLKEQRERSQTASKGMFKGGLADTDDTTIKYHTAAHLLLAALNKHIGANIEQKGSNITADRMRFDFNLDHKMTDEEKKKVEDQINEWIEADLPVVFDEYDKDYAKNTLKAHGQFWDKYPEKLTVYTIGDINSPVSHEVCGGPHVTHTGELGKFKIKKEESSSAGVRRIKGIFV